MSTEVTIKISGKRLRYFRDITITRMFAGFDLVSLSASFDPSSAEQRALFVPFSFAPVVLEVGGDLLFTGHLVDVAPSGSGSETSIGLSAESRAARLADLPLPADSPKEFNRLTLLDIARKITEPSGVAVRQDFDPGAHFERVATEDGSTVLDFIKTLADQRGLIVAADADGDLEFRSTQEGVPVASLDASSVVSSSVSFSPQEYATEVSCVSETKHGRKGHVHTEANPFDVSGFPRPRVQQLPDTEPADLPKATSAMLGRMLGAVATYEIEVASWLTPTDQLWAPGQMVKFQDPRVMVYEPYTFMISRVDLIKTAASESAKITLVLPSVFSGDFPDGVPWS